MSTEKPIAHANGNARGQFQLEPAGRECLAVSPAWAVYAAVRQPVDSLLRMAFRLLRDSRFAAIRPDHSPAWRLRAGLSPRQPFPVEHRPLRQHAPLGNIADNTGTTSIATIASSHTRYRVAAESRFSIMAATAASTSSAVPLTAESTSTRLDALNTEQRQECAIHLSAPPDVLVRSTRSSARARRPTLGPCANAMRGECFFQRAAEERLQHPLEARRPALSLAWRGR